MLKNDDRINFFTKLYELLNKYDVELEVVIPYHGYENYPDGIEFTFNSKWENGELIRPFYSVKIPYNTVDSGRINEILNNLLKER